MKSRSLKVLLSEKLEHDHNLILTIVEETKLIETQIANLCRDIIDLRKRMEKCEKARA